MNYRPEDIEHMVRFSLASKAADVVAQHGGNGSEAASYSLDMLDRADEWLSPEQMALPILERAGLLAYYGPLILKAHYPELAAYYNQSTSRVSLIHALGRVLAAVDEPTVSLVLLNARLSAPIGALTPLGYMRTAVVAAPCQLAYLLCTYVEELRAMPTYDFASWMVSHGALGKLWRTPKEQSIAEVFESKDVELAVMRGFSFGQDLAGTQPQIDDPLQLGEDLVLTPYELHQLAYDGQRSGFKKINLSKEMARAIHH